MCGNAPYYPKSFLVVSLLVLLTGVAHGQTKRWDGGGPSFFSPNSWSSSGNWSPNGEPGTNSDVILDNTFATLPGYIGIYTGEVTGTLSFNTNNNVTLGNGLFIFFPVANGTLDVHDGLISSAGSGNFALTFNTLDLVTTTDFDLNGTGSFTVSSVIDGSGFTKTGSGTLTLNGGSTNTYSGTATVEDGVLELARTAGTTVLTGDVDLEGGTLLLAASNQIADSAGLTLDGGTLSTDGFDETLGTLTFSSSSTINLGGGASLVNFADSSAASWAGSGNLLITNWTDGSDQIFVGNSSAGLTSTQLDRIRFVDPFGPGSGLKKALILSTGEIVPVPEPGALLSSVLIILFVGTRRARAKLPRHTRA